MTLIMIMNFYSAKTIQEHSKPLYIKLKIPLKLIVTMLCYGKYKNKKILKFQSNYLMLNIRTIPRNKKKQNSIKQVQYEQRSDFGV